MLILTRRSNERIFIGDDVVLVVLGIENNRVKLGIEAPAEISILREEISGERRGQNIDKLPGDNLEGGPGYKTGT